MEVTRLHPWPEKPPQEDFIGFKGATNCILNNVFIVDTIWIKGIPA
jgi:hypothetical protein